ncbi:hypothetical protein BJ912DRAFT_1097615 [Pholiota molesta]|nr:hypothetical protein BJ912DRAFT_1097615 [Pholiota molesta]
MAAPAPHPPTPGGPAPASPPPALSAPHAALATAQEVAAAAHLHREAHAPPPVQQTPGHPTTSPRLPTPSPPPHSHPSPSRPVPQSISPPTRQHHPPPARRHALRPPLRTPLVLPPPPLHPDPQGTRPRPIQHPRPRTRRCRPAPGQAPPPFRATYRPYQGRPAPSACRHHRSPQRRPAHRHPPRHRCPRRARPRLRHGPPPPLHPRQPHRLGRRRRRQPPRSRRLGRHPAAFAAGKSDPISPIIVEGLRPLPDLAPQSYHASPLQRQVSPPPAVESHVGPPAEKISPESQPSDKVPTPEASPVDTKPAPSPTNNKMATRKPLHPSLPAKPATVLAVGPSKPVAAATPMRIAPYPNSATHDTFAGRPLPKSAAAEMTPRAAEAHEEPVGEAIAAEEQESITIVEAITTTAIDTAAEVLDAKTPPEREATPAPPPKDPLDDFAAADGLRASIHAPRAAAVDAVRSAPAAVASFADVRPSVPPPPTHTRAHTVGRGPVGGGGRSPGVRAARGGAGGGGAGRGGAGEGGGHLRNHSSPAAAGGAYRSAHAARPVLTGAALSLLTRSIAGGGGSPSKSQTVTPLGD